MSSMQQQQLIPVRPTVFVGMGGTGKEILLRLRMKFYERYGEFGYPCISYLWIDTDMQNLNVDRKEMDPLLQRVIFKEGEKVDIQVDDPGDFLNNPGKFSWITQWMPPAVVQSGLRIQDGAGQVRAKGRFSFYWKFQAIQKQLLEAVTKVRNPQSRFDTARFSEDKKLNLRLDDDWGPRVNFFLASSLAGGTGSGTFLDMAFLIRQIASEQNFKPDITGLLFLSSLFCNEPSDRRYANTYAALKELEYYNYTPEAGARDIEDRAGSQNSNLRTETGSPNVERPKANQVYALRKFEDKWAQNYPQTPVNGPPFNTCYLIDGYTFGGTPITPAHKYEVFDMASEYLFWEFYRGDFASQKRTIRPNNRQYLDKNHGEPHGDEESPFHLQRFSTGYSSFGLSWISIPYGSRIGACAYRLSQEILEYWERGGVLNKEKAQDKLRERNIVDEVRKAVRGDALGLTGQKIVESLAVTRGGTRFSELLKAGVEEFFKQPEEAQVAGEFIDTFEDNFLARRVGAVINDNIEPSKNRTLGSYKESIRKWIVKELEDQGFIPLLGFTFLNADGSQGKVKGYLDLLTDVVLPEVQSEVENIKSSFSDKKSDAETSKDMFLNNVEELDGNFVLFRKMSRKILLRESMKAEQNYAQGEVGEWICEIGSAVINEIRQYVDNIKTRLKLFYDGTLSPVIGEFSNMRQRHEREEKGTLSISLYKNLDEYYRLAGDPVDVKAEKDQLFRTKMPDLWKVVTELTPEQFRKEVEEHGWKKFQDDFQRRFAAGAESESLANAVQLFNEIYPPSDINQRQSQIKIFLSGGKPYVQPRMTLGPRTPLPHEDMMIGIFDINADGSPGNAFFRELQSQYSLSSAQGIAAEREAILYYHELTGLPLFYLSSLEQYRQSYDHFQSRLGELPVHIHRRVDKFPEIFLYNPDEAEEMFTAWETIILGTLLRVLQVEVQGDNFRYFYYSGLSADPKVIGDERGSVRSLFIDRARYNWCLNEIAKRKNEVYQDSDKLKVYYGLLQMLKEKVYTTDSIRLAGGQIQPLPSFQSSVIEKHIRETERSANGTTLPNKNPEGPSPEWDQLMNNATEGAGSIEIDRGGGKREVRYYVKSISPFTVR
jgi:hypothetical protein